MFGDPFYHSVIRKITTVFGTLFNEISIELRDETGAVAQTIQVPIAYGAAEKWLARIRQDSSIDNAVDGQTGVKMTLPRMSFVLTGLTYDSTRQLNEKNKMVQCGIPKEEAFPPAGAGQTDFIVNAFIIDANTVVSVDGIPTVDFTIDIGTNTVTLDTPLAGGEVVVIKEGIKKYQYQRVPYNLEFDLSIMTNKTEDGLKIVEQILPYFSPQLTVSIKLLPDLNIVEDVPFRLEGNAYDDNFDSGFDEQREITWTLNFTAFTYLYKPTIDSKVILFVDDEIGEVPSGEVGAKTVNLIVWEEDGFTPDGD